MLGGYWTFRDQHTRDLAIVKKQQVDLFTRPFEIAVPQKKRKFTDLVFLPSEKKTIINQ